MQLEQDRSLLLKQAEQKLTELSFDQLKIVVDLLGILSPENGQVKNDQSNLGQNFDTPENIRSSKNFLLSIVGLGETLEYQDQQIQEPIKKTSGSSLLNLAGLFSTEEDDLSERCEEILAKEMGQIEYQNIQKLTEN